MSMTKTQKINAEFQPLLYAFLRNNAGVSKKRIAQFTKETKTPIQQKYDAQEKLELEAKRSQLLIEKANRILKAEQKKQEIAARVAERKAKAKENAAKAEREKREREEAKEALISRKYENHFRMYELVHIDNIMEDIERGNSNEFIVKANLGGIRNDIFDLACSNAYCLNYMPCAGDVKEHFNSRTTIGIYALWLILNDIINDDHDLRKFYLEYAAWIWTTAKFNNHISYLQNEPGGILANKYIEEYQSEPNFPELSEDQKRKFSSRFLTANFGKVTADMVIDLIRERMKHGAKRATFVCSEKNTEEL